jgi:DNA-binding NarL/FixJ family response regulator
VTSAAPVAVLLVDDQEPFRVAARAVLSRLAGFEVAAEAASGERAIELADAQPFDLVLMDINMGAVDGIEATLQITTRRPETLVVLMSTYPVEDLPAGALTCGAAAYVNKDELSPRQVRRLWEAGGDPDWLVARCGER